MQALSKISDIISQLKKKKEEDDEDVDISDLEIIFMKILNVLKTGLEEDKQRFATERMFQEERDYEDQKRHEEFLSVLKQFVSLQPMEKPEEDKKTSGILDFFKNLIETLKNFFKVFLIPKLLKIFGTLKNVFSKTIEIVGKLIKKIGSLMMKVIDFVKKMPWGKIFSSLGRILLNIGRFAGPIGLLISSIAGLSYLFGELVKRVPNMSALDYKQAEGLLGGGDKQIEDALKAQPLSLPEKYMKMTGTARQKVETFVTDEKKLKLEELSRKEGTGATLTPDEQTELNKLRTTPILPTVQTTPDKVNPRPPFEGVGVSWNQWNQRYFRDYNPDGTRRTVPTNEPIPTTQDELKRRREQQERERTQTATPIRTDTSATEFNRKQEEIGKISQVLTERVKELQENKKILNESVYKERDPKKRIEIINQTKKVNEELTLREKQLRDLQRGIIPQDLPRSRTSLLPMTPMPAEMTQPTAASTATPMAPAEQEQSVPSATPMAPVPPPAYLPQPEMSEPQSAAPVQEPNRVTNLFNTVNQENRMLELARTMSTNQMSESDTVVNNIGKTEVIPDVPLSVEASQRDDTHTLSVVLSRYKRAYV